MITDYERFRVSQNPYMQKVLISPLTGSIGGDTDFDNTRDPAYYLMKSHLRNAGRSDLLLGEENIKNAHIARMARHNHHLFGPYRRCDEIFRDNSPYTTLGESAEYKVPFDINKNDVYALQKLEQFRQYKNNDFDQHTMYESDMTELSKEYIKGYENEDGSLPDPQHLIKF